MSTPLIIDQRGRLRRRVLELWRIWESNPPRWLDTIVALTSRINTGFINRRLQRRDPRPDLPFLISVGNLISGGSGKTPVVMDLARALSRKGISGAILVRGYGSRLKGPLRVDPLDPACADEARLLAEKCRDWIVVQSRDRKAGLDYLEMHVPGLDLVILEDAFQSAGVPRHLDVLILDRWQDTESGPLPGVGFPLPWGPYREGAAAADRADIWILNRLGAVGDASISGTGIPVLRMERRPVLADAARILGGRPYGILSGIADPSGFESICPDLCGYAPSIIGRFDDHASYSPTTLAALWRAGRDLAVELWLVTAKDRIKLAEIWPVDLELIEVDLVVEWAANRSLADIVTEHLNGDQDA